VLTRPEVTPVEVDVSVVGTVNAVVVVQPQEDYEQPDYDHPRPNPCPGLNQGRDSQRECDVDVQREHDEVVVQLGRAGHHAAGVEMAGRVQ